MIIKSIKEKIGNLQDAFKRKIYLPMKNQSYQGMSSQ